MPPIVHKTGPGTLQIGETGTEQDFSVQVTSCAVEPETDQEDDVIVLSGDTVPGAITDSATLTGTVFQDLNASGLVAYAWSNHGEVLPFTFTPKTSAGATVTGNVRVTRLSIGGDVDANAQSDFEWSIIGDPTFTPGTDPAAAVAQRAKSKTSSNA